MFRVVAMYAATAFIILEVVDIVSPALSLPPWTLTLVIVLLAIGFPLAAIFSWIFDITPGGIKKTELVKPTELKNAEQARSRRGMKVSDGIIGVLLLAVCILIYPEIFRNDKFEGIREPDGQISIAVMPFANLSGDPIYDVWQGGFQNLLIATLSNSEELSVRQYQAMTTILGSKKDISNSSITPSIASELALTLETRTFILGNILKAGNKVRINAQLVNAETEEIYKTYHVEGIGEESIFAMADSLSGLIKNFLEIENLMEQYDSPDFRGSFLTSSAEAFQYYIHGYEAFEATDYTSSREWFAKAIAADSSFISPYVALALMTYDRTQAKKLSMQAYRYRDDLPIKGRLMVDYLHAYFFESPYEQIKYLKQILEIEELNTLYWYLMGCAHYWIDQYEEAVFCFEKALGIHKGWGTHYLNPGIYFFLGESYHELNQHQREIEAYDLGLSLFPDDPVILEDQAICAFSRGDTMKGKICLNDYKNSRRNISLWSESKILSREGNIYEEAHLYTRAESSYRKAIELEPENPDVIHDLAWFLIDKEINVDEGLKLVEISLELDPDNYHYLDTKGWGLSKQGRHTEALELLTHAWEVKPAYDHEVFKHIQDVKEALSNQRN